MKLKVARLNFRNVSSARWLLTMSISAIPLTLKVIIEINIAVDHLHKVWIRVRKAHKSEKNRDYSKGEFFVHFFTRSVKGTKNVCMYLDMTICIKVSTISVIEVIQYLLPVTDWTNIISAFKFYFTALTFKWIVHQEIIHREWLCIRCNKSHKLGRQFFCNN